MSSKGIQLVIDKAGHFYYKHRTNKDQTIVWKCREHNTYCNAKVKTHDKCIVKYMGVHFPQCGKLLPGL